MPHISTALVQPGWCGAPFVWAGAIVVIGGLWEVGDTARSIICCDTQDGSYGYAQLSVDPLH
ncbi:hypothetical protein PAXRUDRAFT_828273 [Paxillus rubicundulus Ve08.2h10]|uniref:Uncharacterized protein n=1 Tax=Paxillus rubicundulus Ve08.2h10 TaxID=930991 RepID=A0A0D0DWE1_9AGAM|nr:hypothetical protein PAXRUDRAFT_828273 [Paxillus rubicundulus Ve08.2h10]